MKKIKYNIILSGFVFSLFISSCKKFVDIEPAPNIITTDVIFNDDKVALTAVNGVYLQMRNSNSQLFNSSLSVLGGLLADEIYNITSNANFDPFLTNSLLSTSGDIRSQFWSIAYTTIYRANAIIEGLNGSTLLTDSVKKQLTGEMKVVRALHYFYMVNLFGDVPLVITTDYQVNAIMPRTPAPQVYEQVITDLKDAQELLKSTYPSTGKVRPNRHTATALLARVYLYMKDWANAEIQATNVISSGTCSLVTKQNIANTFVKNSTETIWELTSRNEANNTAEGGQFVPPATPTTTPPTFAATSSLLNAFETGDVRKTNWLGLRATYLYPNKYKARTTATPVTEYNIVFRLAEQFLIRAEARAQQNNISGCQVDLDTIRTRAGLLKTTANTQASLLSAIERERQVELFAEWGHRWLDLKRTNRADAVLLPVKGTTNWQSTDVLFPIPFNELLYNPFLTQNPGY